MADLKADLQDVAESFISAALSAPLGLRDGPRSLSNTQRKKLLLTKVIGPAAALIELLKSPDRAEVFSEFPETFSAAPPDREVLLSQLEALKTRGEDIVWCVELRGRTHALSDFKVDLTIALVDAFRRHVVDEEGRPIPEERVRRSPYEASADALRSPFSLFIENCMLHIFPDDDLFSGQLLDEFADEIVNDDVETET